MYLNKNFKQFFTRINYYCLVHLLVIVNSTLNSQNCNKIAKKKKII